MLASDTEAIAPVALTDTPAPLPDTSPVVTVPPVFVTPAELLVTPCVMLPTVVPATPALPIDATEIDAAAPVAPTDAEAPPPERAPTVSPVEVFATAPVFEMV